MSVTASRGVVDEEEEGTSRARALKSMAGPALRPAFVYLLLGVVWILVSDRLLASLVEDPRLLTTLQTVKGWAFVVLSALVIYSLVRHEIDRIQRAHKRFRSLVEHALAGVCVVQDGRLAYVNPRLAEIFGTSVDDLLAVGDVRELAVEEHRSMLDRVLAPEDASRPSAPPHDSFGSRTLRILRRNGTECPVEVAAQPLEWQGRPGVIAMVLDRSEEERLEEQLRHAQKMEAIGQLTGSIAHDFNNLLTAAGVPIELALLELDGGRPVRPDLEEAQAAIARATQLSQQLLTFSRRRVIRPQVVDLNAAVRELARMLERLVGDDVALVVDPGGMDGHVMIAPSHLEQVLANLVVNARDAMPAGGTITIRTFVAPADPDVLRHRQGLRPGPHAVLEVSDTGHGIEEGAKQRIFEPFFTTKEKGTGLGLSTVFGIVRQAEGFVRVESEPGCATSMRVYLPLCESGEGPAESIRGEREEARTIVSDVVQEKEREGKTILVVDDDVAVQRVMERVLSRAGFQVLRAGHPHEALELARQHDGVIDLMITDLMLPAMDGIALGAAFEEHRPGTPVLYSSGYSEDEITERIRHDPTLPFLEKPFQVRELLDFVAGMLANRRTSPDVSS